MKTYIIKLDPHDDIISARDKMGWAKAERILLIWPARVSLLNRQLDLVLLQRHSEALGAQLGLVTRDAAINFYAPDLGILVFKHLRQAQRSRWRLPRHLRKFSGKPIIERQATPSNLQDGDTFAEKISPSRRALPLPPPPKTELHPVLRAMFFFLGVLSVLSLTALLIPSAVISLTPVIREQETLIEIHASPETTQVNLSGAVPARAVNITVEGREFLPVSGSIIFPDKASIGEVIFTNLTDSPVIIPKNAIIRSQDEPALSFTVTQEGRLAAGTGQTISLPVRCLTLGSQGNLPAGKLVAIDGLLGTKVTVTNPQPTRFGSNRQEPAPTDSDHRALHEKLLQSLQESALAELQRSLEENDLVLTPSPHLVQIIAEDYLPAGNQPADQLSLNVRAEFQALIVSGQNLITLVESVLNSNLPPGFNPLSKTLQITNLSAPRFEGSLAIWKLAAHRQLVATIPAIQATRLVLGLSPQQASKRLEENLPLAAPPQIDLSPHWWPRLTILPFRIQVIMAGSQPHQP